MFVNMRQLWVVFFRQLSVNRLWAEGRKKDRRKRGKERLQNVQENKKTQPWETRSQKSARKVRFTQKRRQRVEIVPKRSSPTQPTSGAENPTSGSWLSGKHRIKEDK